jgi:hypothetical protein
LIGRDPDSLTTVGPIDKGIVHTYKNQSTARISVISSVGSPTAVSTITIVTRPACGTPAAPIEAAVEVILKWEDHGKTSLLLDASSTNRGCGRGDTKMGRSW